VRNANPSKLQLFKAKSFHIGQFLTGSRGRSKMPVTTQPIARVSKAKEDLSLT
jgi:hypothetical protein